ncbi:hypothetical protein BOS5A_230865 [Bosea sp. EC-HK365B]|nr:hypothetical protein BOSE7B_50553 [Bosea sp. 7B]CAD5299012.1 hypothetical protein BOSE21B_90941 [Bosea sp. 21B]VVT61588.1 hypothetical protein BOS5A_230865 [Bosea sp. EC-HK365B]VXB09032.1 hypothetical protein BOSE127_100223 [Bosea sp. 127]
MDRIETADRARQTERSRDPEDRKQDSDLGSKPERPHRLHRFVSGQSFRKCETNRSLTEPAKYLKNIKYLA